MKIVLAKTISQFGTIGDTKEVSEGYARNYLLTRGLAVLPDDPRAKEFRRQQQAAREAQASQSKILSELGEQWRGKEFSLKARASQDGMLYGSIGLKEVKKLLGRDDLSLEVPTIKTTGRHKVDLKFAGGVTVPVTIVVEPESK